MTSSQITYAGHAAFFIESRGKTLAIDPWLKGNPLCPEELQNPDKLNTIVLTHGHADHASEAIGLAKRTGATVIGIIELTNLLVRDGLSESQVIPMNKGGTVENSGFKVTLTNAFHSNSYESSTGTEYAGEACGVVINDGSTSIYHAGDTCLFSDISLIREFYKPQVALLPIGDHFTMGPKEAAKAAELIGSKTLIPMHYKTFDLLTGTAAEFKEACSKLEAEVVELNPGKSLEV